MYRQREIEDAFDQDPEFNVITAEKAESFKDYHQDERKARTMKWPWFSFQVDYDYFTFRKFRVHYWPKIQLLIFLLYILPTFYYAGDRFLKNEYQACIFSLLRNKGKSWSKGKEARRSKWSETLIILIDTADKYQILSLKYTFHEAIESFVQGVALENAVFCWLLRYGCLMDFNL